MAYQMDFFRGTESQVLANLGGKVKYPAFQNELKDWNIFKANFYDWNTLINNNIHCIIALTLLGLAILFVIAGVILHKKRKRNLR